MAPLDLIPVRERAEAHRPWARALVDNEGWGAAIDRLESGDLTLVGLWGDAGAVHLAVLDAAAEIAVLTYHCVHGSYPSVGARHPPALRLERAIHDLFGLKAAGAPDTRPWLDLGFWDVAHPLGHAIPAPPHAPYAFLPAEGEALHQIPVGPVHAGIIEPGHFRFSANGETVVRLEQRLGYVHKGIEALMHGATLVQGAKLAGRTSGDSTVAYAYAFARAAEAALQVDIPPRAIYLRAVMAELERIANHLGDFGAICNDASFSLMHAQCFILRELTLRASQACFGHRLMMDCIVPGGVATDLAPDGPKHLRALLGEIRRRFPELVEVYDNTASLQDRTVSTGILKPELARQFGAGGYVGRASGRGVDARRNPGYPPYDSLQLDVPVLSEGDVNARVWIRIREIEQSLGLIDQILADLPGGPIKVEVAGAGAVREGAALVEAFRGDIFLWLRAGADGKIARCHLRDPSWFQWPLLEAAIEGNIVADFPLCNKSFNCSYSGHDL
ncbi:MAG TPA: NADH-quinone oxidoreductase subunit C [Xanthobacteraceae bacterium]|nr:NADH-quinone oxidoreductase subunit C [Xanthobacteraceae bacterium]